MAAAESAGCNADSHGFQKCLQRCKLSLSVWYNALGPVKMIKSSDDGLSFAFYLGGFVARHIIEDSRFVYSSSTVRRFSIDISETLA